MSNKVQSGMPPVRDRWTVISSTTGASPVPLEAKAARLHMLGRLRAKHFYTPVMADSAMDVMLSLLVGELQSSRVSDTALAVGNVLSPGEAFKVIDQLVQAGLVTVSGEEPEQRTVGLTPLGSVKIRRFVSAYPDV